LLLDEPLAALDPQLRGDLRRQLASIIEDAGCGTLIVTHDQHEALALADKIAILQKGELVQYGSPNELWLRPVNAFVADFLTNSALLDVDVTAGTASAFNGQWRIPVSELRVEEDARTQPQILIRPDALRVADLPADDTFEAVVDTVEYAGGKLEAVVIAPDKSKLLLTTSDRMVASGDRLDLAVIPGAVSLIGTV
jgi:ABC-type Fe3+/spermidine/putrescine transport system ATPase subunit